MNVGFDVTAILGEMGKNRGIGAYTLAEFREIISQDVNNQYFAFNYLEDAPICDMLGNPPNLEVEFLWTGENQELIRHNLGKDILGNLVKSFLKKNRIDVFYITAPFDESVIPYEKDWFAGVKVLATVYDIIPYIMKDYYLSNLEVYNRYMERIEGLRIADKLVAISQSVKTDLVEQLGFQEEKIEVIWGAPDPKFHVKRYTDIEKEALYHKFGIEDKFVMCTGGDDERKNISGLIRAFSKLDRLIRSEYQLVIVCKLTEQGRERYEKVIKNCHLDGRVILTGYVSDDELLMFYNLAALMAFPSKYEGFGLPVVEAFACGTPVLTSNNSSLVEIAGDAAIIVDPFDVKDIAKGLERALRAFDLAALVKKGEDRLKLYQWSIVAERVIRVIEESVKKDDVEFAKIKDRIAMFTPLPPIPSGISDYSVLIISELKKYYDIDVYIDDGYITDAELGDGVNIYSHTEFVNHYNQYIDVIYQMGNSGFHFYMYDYIYKYSGIVVLHDHNLHGSFYEYTVHVKKSYELYKDFVREDYGDVQSIQYVEKIRNGVSLPQIYDMELNGKIMNRANKIIVHSNWTKERLLQKNIGRCVRKIQLGVDITDLVDRNKYRERYGLKTSDIVIAAFGQIHQTKRNLQSLKAFARLCVRYPNLKYICAGKVDRGIEADFLGYIKENKLQDKVIITGFISLQAFDEYIDLSDICLNLRYPYQGETSGSLVRLLSKAKPVVVNDIGSFSEIPDEACVKIPDVATMLEEEEIAAIEAALERLITDRQYQENKAAEARKFAVNELDVQMVAKDYKEFIETERYSMLSEMVIEEIKDTFVISDSNCLKKIAHTLAYMKE